MAIEHRARIAAALWTDLTAGGRGPASGSHQSGDEVAHDVGVLVAEALRRDAVGGNEARPVGPQLETNADAAAAQQIVDDGIEKIITGHPSDAIIQGARRSRDF